MIHNFLFEKTNKFYIGRLSKTDLLNKNVGFYSELKIQIQNFYKFFILGVLHDEEKRSLKRNIVPLRLSSTFHNLTINF